MHGLLFERVVRFQYFLDLAGVCVLKIMVAPYFTEQDRLAIRAPYQAKVGDEVQFNVLVVDEIPLSVRGNQRWLIHGSVYLSRYLWILTQGTNFKAIEGLFMLIEARKAKCVQLIVGGRRYSLPIDGNANAFQRSCGLSKSMSDLAARW